MVWETIDAKFYLRYALLLRDSPDTQNIKCPSYW